ncbi:MAG: tannase/feruloyl esterase family alpha/beta hydrolase [Bryobacterales bacterium]|nr:tannase/feruloyl esterase family alpha/beta hydrolase [Bryobacterales bacterium]
MPVTPAWCWPLLLAAAILRGAQPGTIEIDTREWRAEPVRHFYIHGVVNGDTRFRVCLPEKAAWKGRVIQYLGGAFGGYELTGDAGVALSAGAVYVESNQGHIGRFLTASPNDSHTELQYEASYATLQYAKSRAVEFYGIEPSYVYVHGDSGGGMRASGLLERFPKSYDGAIGYVGVGSPTALIPKYSRYEEFCYKIASKTQAMADAVRPGGSGDPFAVLSTGDQRAALRAVLLNGFPARQLEQLSPSLVSAQLIDAMFRVADPDFVSEFWRNRGNAGLEGFSGKVRAIQASTIDTGIPQVAGALTNYSIRFASGAAAGTWRPIVFNKDSSVTLSPYAPDASSVKPGDGFEIDNRELMAWRSYYRYLGPDSPARRPESVVRMLSGDGRPLGQFKGKLMVLYSVDDPYAWASFAVDYDRMVWARQGTSAKERYRLYFFERIPHGPVTRPLWEIPWGGARQKALIDLIAWVERGVPPPPGTSYRVNELNQVVLPAGAAARAGLQPVAVVTANGTPDRLEIRAGQEVVFRVSAADPDNELEQFEIDYFGTGTGGEKQPAGGRSASAIFRHTYEKPGAHFANVRTTDKSGISNLAYVRVIVHQGE